MKLVDKLLNNETLQQSVAWLCASRKKFPANSDIWDFRFHYQQERQSIKWQISHRRYRFKPMLVINKADDSQAAIWSSRDAMVLKCLTLVCQNILPCHRLCTHIAGHGGHKYTVQKTHDYLKGGHYPYVCKTDIKGYYANIDKQRLLDALAKYITCPTTLNLLSQFIHYSVEKGGNFHTPLRGIPRSSSLSPLLAGFYLYEVDQHFAQQQGIRYLRFMDDIIILCKTRWQLRRQVVKLNDYFAQYKLKQHPDKTFIGKAEKGFDWLGYAYNEKGLVRISDKTVQKFTIKLRRLYEQARFRASSTEDTLKRVADYHHRWQRWVQSGLPRVDYNLSFTEIKPALETLICHRSFCLPRLVITTC